MAKNEFRPSKFQDFTIQDENSQVVGHIRVKPNAVLWCPKGEHNWYNLTLAQFAKFATESGKKQKK